MPVLLVLLLGIVEFGHALNSYLTVLASARDAARMAAQGGASHTTLLTQISNETKRLPNNTPVPTPNDSSCNDAAGGVCIWGTQSNGDGNTTAGCLSSGSVTTVTDAKDCVRVKVCYKHEMIVGIPFFTSDKSLRLCSQTVMRLADP